MEQTVETWNVRIKADTSELQENLAEASSAGRQFGRALSTAFQSVALQGKGVSDTLRSLAMTLSKTALSTALKPMEQVFGNLLQNAMSGNFDLARRSESGMVVPFANGGVIASPIAFPMQGGATGIAGERGAEAIMPLARGPDGRLGVRADSAGGNVAVTFNITTADADSFRRTETQIAAMLGRAVAQGQRNL